MKRWISVTAGIGILASLVALSAQAPSGTPFRIEKLDPALDEVIAPDAQLETLGEHFALTEGPVWIPRQNGQPGYLLFSDNAANVIYKWAANTPLSVFLENSGFTGRDNSNVGAQTIAGRVAILLIGSNGLALDPEGRLVVTAMTDRTVYRLEKDGTRTILADRFEGKRFNGPNDIVVKSNGADLLHRHRLGASRRRAEPSTGTALQRILSDQGRQSHTAWRRPGYTRRVAEWDHAIAGRKVSLRDCRRPAHHALRHPAGRHRRQRESVCRGRHRRNARRHQRKSVYDQRRNTRAHPDQFTRRQTHRTPASAATHGGTPSPRVRHQHGFR